MCILTLAFLGNIQITQAPEQTKLSPTWTTPNVTMLEKLPFTITQILRQEKRLIQAITHAKKTRGDRLKINVLKKMPSAPKIVSLPTEKFEHFLNKRRRFKTALYYSSANHMDLNNCYYEGTSRRPLSTEEITEN